MASPGDSKGMEEYNGQKETIFDLRDERQQAIEQNLQKFLRAHEAADMRVSLNREVYFLKNYLEQIQTPTLSFGWFSSTETPPTPTPKPRAEERKHRQYKRYLDENIEMENLMVTRARMMDARLSSELQDIMIDIQQALAQKHELLTKIGITSPADIPGLIPQRKPSSDNLRGEFMEHSYDEDVD